MLILKGFIVGLGKIIPGVSGSMIAISLGLYEKLIYSINNFFQDIINNSKFLIKFLTGVLIAICLFSKIVIILLNKYYVTTIFAFIGLIIGSLNKINDKANIKKNYKLVLLIIILVSIMSNLAYSNDIIINNIFFEFIYWLFVGLIEAISTVVPGISGTSMLMMIGAYNKLMLVLSELINVDNFIYNFQIILPFFVGMIVGMFFVTRLISYLLKHYKEKTYCIICGFSYSSILVMITSCLKKNFCIADIFISIIMFFVCYFVSKKVNHLTSD